MICKSIRNLHCFSSLRLLSTLPKATSGSSFDRSNAEFADVDWDNLGFRHAPTDYMYTMKCSEHAGFKDGHLRPYGSIELSPCANVINYGQGLFEGVKAYSIEDGRIVLFRPDQNAMRMQMGAERMCMVAPSAEQFVDALKQTALANKRWIPPPGKGSLYMRPLLLGTGAILGVAPAPEYTFLVYACPVGNYFKEETGLNLFVEDEYDRAARGGVGGVKAISNYGPALKPLMRAKSRGFSDVLYLDSVHKKYIEELSSSNIFLVKDGMISTPPTNGTILPGVTRKSVIEIARDLGHNEVEERLILVEELAEADEVFCTGTAAVVAPVRSTTHKGKRVEYETGENAVWKKVLSMLVGIQNGEIEDDKGWLVQV